MSDLVDAGMDYWALGHVHLRQILRSGDPWVVYSGDLQGRSPKPSEQGAKGAFVVEVEGTKILEPEFVPLDVVRFERLDIDAAELTVAKLETGLLTRASELLEASDGRSLLVRCRLTGRGDIHADLARKGALEELLRDMRDEFSDEVPFLWWESIRDRTAPEADIDIAAIRQRGDFAAVVLEVADELRDSEDEFPPFIDDAFKELPAGALARLDVPIHDEVDEGSWNDAVLLALELLTGGES